MSFSENDIVLKTNYQNVSGYIVLQSGKGLTTFNYYRNNLVNFAAENKLNEDFLGIQFLYIGDKNLKSNLILVVIVLEPKGLQ